MAQLRRRSSPVSCFWLLEKVAVVVVLECSFVFWSLFACYSIVNLADACYKFPADTADPCAEKECQFGAECKVRLDGKSAECVCPERCTSYGDSKGSRPVCGSDGKDYPSVCELRRTACKEMREISVKYQGSCGKYDSHYIYLALSSEIKM